MSVEIHGVCAERFAAIREAFCANFARDLEIGATLAMTWRGELMVDIWAGDADPARTRPWRRDTIVHIASSSKIAATLSLLMVIDRGLISLDDTVARYWPEFSHGGKQHVTVRDVLTHQAGVPSLNPPASFVTACDWPAMTARIACEPHWSKGARDICYHACTFGFIAGELVRRVDGRLPRQFLEEEIAAPLAADIQLGCWRDVDHPRVALVRPPQFVRTGVRDQLFGAIELAPSSAFGLQDLQFPGLNCLANGRALALLGGVFANGGSVNGVRLLSHRLVRDVARTQAEGVCPYLGAITWGLGLALDNPGFPAPTPSAIHWGGFGGSWMVADPLAKVSLGYAPNNFRLDGDEQHDRRLGRFWHVLRQLLPELPAGR